MKQVLGDSRDVFGSTILHCKTFVEVADSLDKPT